MNFKLKLILSLLDDQVNYEKSNPQKLGMGVWGWTLQLTAKSVKCPPLPQ